ncbi:MAG: putative metallopeptidase WLM domain protein [Satyrvirus sp.]|uniref:Putative metallopeptidase WLM domain protein n=1 Tax=Satyrvirus sp. TaxID=2487771 RepID=A0A3G5ADC1_9VIRU|nr:MAG: putative metallopeptidase WLM domain protein [Satyrvirus sp.]
MKIIHLILVIILLAILIYFFYKFFKTNSTCVKSNLNNKEYLVQNLDDKKNASYVLSIIHYRIFLLCDYLQKNINNFPEYKSYIERLLKKINKIVLVENAPDNNNTSYTINKGDEIVLCMRSKKTWKLHDLNILMYVVLHELAHVACPEIDHTELFKKIFIFLLKVSNKIDIYEIINYEIDPHEYCGLIINETLV